MICPVKWFSEEMTGAPILSTDTGVGTPGTLVALLKACLVTGFNVKSIATLTYDSASKTGVATFATAHGYKPNSIVLIENSGDTAWDGEHRIKSVTSQSITFEQLTAPSGGVTGAGSCKVAPAGGWVMSFADGLEQIAIFKRTDPASTPLQLRVDNSAWTGWNGAAGARFYLAKVAMVDDVVDLNNYTLIKEHYWPAAHAFSSVVQWDLVADSRLMYFVPRYTVAAKSSVLAFGDINSARKNDNYQCILTGIPAHAAENHYAWSTVGAAINYGWFPFNDFLKFGTDSVKGYRVSPTALPYHKLLTIARQYHQLPGADDCTLLGVGAAFGMGVAFPNGADGGFYVNDGGVPLLEMTSNTLRGFMPGLVAPYQNDTRMRRYMVNIDPTKPNKIVRFLLATACIDQGPSNSEDNVATDPLLTNISGFVSGWRTTERLFGLDIVGPWR